MKLFLVVLLLFAFNCVFAQNSYQQDLDFLYQAAKKLPAYHDQVRGKEKAAYDKLYTQLRSREVGKSVVDTFTVLSSLLWPFKDKHLAFWMPLRNESDAISIMPFVAEDPDSLKNVLKHSPRDSVEGIYHAGKQMLVGIYRTTTKDSLNCVVLESQAKAFSPGQLLGTLFQRGGDSFRMILVDPQSRSLLYSPGVRVTHGRFHVCDLRKEVEPSHSEFWPGEPYRFRKIGPNTAYLYLGTFYSSDENLKRASAFAESIKDSLISDHLIVDIRGNMGGGDKCSRQFYDLIKKYSRRGEVYVLINSWVYSNAEQFAVRLKALKNVTLYGEKTDGTITYGNNSGRTLLLPSGRFKFYPTDMKDRGGFLKYEEGGVEPDVFLHSRSDWLEQVQAMIMGQKNR